MRKAVFLDRDGVLNELVVNPETQDHESPLSAKELKIFPNVFSDLKKLNKADFLLFVVSNQPNFAKGKSSLEALTMINGLFASQMKEQGVDFREYFYCYHHPQGANKEYAVDCQCRKPKPFFLLQAQKQYGLDMAHSWMVGDRDTDVQCGQAAGTRTILVDGGPGEKYRGKSRPDHKAGDLTQAVDAILKG